MEGEKGMEVRYYICKHCGNIVEKVKDAYVAEGHTADSVKKIRVYIKPEEGMAYYVVNDDYASGISLF